MNPLSTGHSCLLTGSPEMLAVLRPLMPHARAVALDELSEAIHKSQATALVVLAAGDAQTHLTAFEAWVSQRGRDALWSVSPGASTAEVRELMRSGAIDVIYEADWVEPLLTSLAAAAECPVPTVLDLLPVMVTHTSREGQLLYANAAARKQFPVERDAHRLPNSGVTDFYADRADRSTLMMRLQSEGTVHVNTTMKRANGDRYPIELVAMALREPDRRIKSIVAISIPTTKDNPLWDIVRSTNERFRQLADAITDLMVASDDSGIVTYWNTTAQAYSGLTSEQTVGLRIVDVLEMLLSEGAQDVAAAISSGGTSTVDFHVPKNTSGNLAPGDYQARIYSSATGTVIIGVDLTDQTRTERALRAALADRETLLREVHHRTKNNLQIITSLLNLTFLPGADPEMRSKLADIQRRVHTMALLHEQLYRGEDLSGIDSQSYIAQLCLHLLSSFQTQNRIQLDLSLASVSLGLDTSLRTGLLLHELMVNSLKHAFPGDRTGTITVALTIAGGGDALELHVADDGVGFSAKPSSGIGLQLVDSLVAQLRGTQTRSTTGGTDVRITYPWEDT